MSIKMNNLPSWITDLVGAIIIGSLGYFSRSIIDKINGNKSFKKERIEKLNQFKNHLDLSKFIFDNQCILRNRLWKSLRERFTTEVKEFEEKELGYNSGLEQLFDKMTGSEKEDFQMIRGITEESMKKANDLLLKFAEENSSNSLNITNEKTVLSFDNDMRDLKNHLNMWNAKFNSIFQNNPKHCLVYIHDERSIGPKFPSGIDQRISQIIQEYK